MTATWKQGLSERDRKEVEFATVYTNHYAHGTDGHTRLLLVAKLAGMLDEADAQQAFPYPATLDVEGFIKWLESGHEQPVITGSAVIVRAKASDKRGEKRFIVSSLDAGDDLLPTPVPGRFLTVIVSDPPMSQGGKL